jgi:hypothetical protein
MAKRSPHNFRQEQKKGTKPWCGRPDLNRHGKLFPRDFKSDYR